MMICAIAVNVVTLPHNHDDMTTPSHTLHAVRRHPQRAATVAVLLLTLWQLPGVVFGLDLCDTGFYLTFYDHIFSAPASVEYNFMYYLSGVAGGAFRALWPSGGLLWMRMVGLAAVMFSIIITWRALRPLLPVGTLTLGMAMMVASLGQLPYTFNNDLLTMALYAPALALMLRGVLHRRLVPLALAGILLGMNVFSRIPNVLALALVATPLLARLYVAAPWRVTWRQCAVMAAGAAAGVAAVLALMAILGHLHIFTGHLRTLLDIASGNAGVASHNASALLTAPLIFYARCLGTAAKFAVLLLAVAGARRTPWRWLHIAVTAAAAAAAIWIMLRQPMLQPLWVMCLAGCAWTIARGNPSLRVAAWLALAMLLMFPLGSDGATNNGAIIALWAAPVAARLWRRPGWVWLAVALLLTGACRTVTRGAYFDGTPLWNKTVTVASPHLRGVLTEPARASVVNHALEGLQGQVAPGDTLLCFGSIPMMNHLTATCPAMGCSWPELLSTRMLVERLALLDASRPPVLRQKFDTLGDTWSEPDPNYLTRYPHPDKFRQQDKLNALRTFLQRNQYTEVWHNDHFVLYRAPRR